MNAFPVFATCYTHLSLFLPLPPSFRIGFMFPPQSVSTHNSGGIQSRPQLFLRFSCLVSHAPLYTRRARVSIYVSFIVFSFPSSPKPAAFVLSFSRGLLPSSILSVPLCSVPPRFLPVEYTTVSLSSFPLPANASPSSFRCPFISGLSRLDTHTSILGQNCIICSYLQQNGTKRTTAIHTKGEF